MVWLQVFDFSKRWRGARAPGLNFLLEARRGHITGSFFGNLEAKHQLEQSWLGPQPGIAFSVHMPEGGAQPARIVEYHAGVAVMQKYQPASAQRFGRLDPLVDAGGGGADTGRNLDVVVFRTVGVKNKAEQTDPHTPPAG